MMCIVHLSICLQDKAHADGPCKPSNGNCSVYDATGSPLLPFSMNLTTR